MAEQLDIVDIHTHLWPADRDRNASRRAISLPEDIQRKIVSPDALLDEFGKGGVSLAVLSTTVESLFGAEGPVEQETITTVNDWLAGLVSAHPGRLAALGVVDAFAGERGAAEAERVLGQLGFAGLVIDSSRDGRFLADPAVRPVIEVANRHKAPIFVHPVSAPQTEILIAGAGKPGNSLGRGLQNGVAFLSLLESDILDAFPDVSFIFATLGLGAIVPASRGGRYGREARAARQRPNIYFDTMGDDPSIIRILAEFFGPERVLAGTDWPILPALAQDTLRENLVRAGLDEEERKLVAGLNARRILKNLPA